MASTLNNTWAPCEGTLLWLCLATRVEQYECLFQLIHDMLWCESYACESLIGCEWIHFRCGTRFVHVVHMLDGVLVRWMHTMWYVDTSAFVPCGYNGQFPQILTMLDVRLIAMLVLCWLGERFRVHAMEWNIPPFVHHVCFFYIPRTLMC